MARSFQTTAGANGVFLIGTGKGRSGDVDESAIDVVISTDPANLVPIYFGETQAIAKAMTGYCHRPAHPPLRLTLEPGDNLYAAAASNVVVHVLQTRRPD